jgi:hypothetical protein
MTYTIKLDERVLVHTDWPPMAQAAWTRATRDRDAAQHGGTAELWSDSTLVAQVRPEIGRGHPWPEGHDCDLRDVLKALLQLLRDDDWGVKEIAQAMTAFGLPTTRGRIDGLRGSSAGQRSEVTAAELVVMISAVLNQYKKGDAS